MRFCSNIVFLRFSWLFKERLLFKASWTDISLQKRFFSRWMYEISRFCLNMPDAYFLSKLLCCMFPLSCQRLFGWLFAYCRGASIYVVAAELMDRTELNLILWPQFQNYLRYLLSAFSFFQSQQFFHNYHYNISTETEPLQKWVQNPLCFEEQRSMWTDVEFLSHCTRIQADKSTKNNQIPLHHGFRWFWWGQFSLSASQRNAGVQGWFLKHITGNSFRYLDLLINTLIILCIFKKTERWIKVEIQSSQSPHHKTSSTLWATRIWMVTTIYGSIEVFWTCLFLKDLPRGILRMIAVAY